MFRWRGAPLGATRGTDLAGVLVLAAGLIGVDTRALAAQGSDSRATITGVVVDTGSRPILGAVIAIIGTRLGAVTDASGRFAIRGIPAELQVVSLKRVGYQPRYFHVHLERGQHLDFEIELKPLPQQLPVVLVEEKAIGAPVLKPDRLAYTTKFDAFYIRRARGSGMYFDRDDLNRAGASDLIDLFRSVPGARVALSGHDRVVRFDGCPNPTLYVDGVQAGLGLYALPELRLREVEAVEIYRHGAGMPPEVVRGCAAVFVWMRTR
jgi:hypothetical protein